MDPNQPDYDNNQGYQGYQDNQNYPPPSDGAPPVAGNPIVTSAAPAGVIPAPGPGLAPRPGPLEVYPQQRPQPRRRPRHRPRGADILHRGTNLSDYSSGPQSINRSVHQLSFSSRSAPGPPQRGSQAGRGSSPPIPQPVQGRPLPVPPPVPAPQQGFWPGFGGPQPAYTGQPMGPPQPDPRSRPPAAPQHDYNSQHGAHPSSSSQQPQFMTGANQQPSPAVVRDMIPHDLRLPPMAGTYSNQGPSGPHPLLEPGESVRRQYSYGTAPVTQAPPTHYQTNFGGYYNHEPPRGGGSGHQRSDQEYPQGR